MDRCVHCGARLGGCLKYLCTTCWYRLPPMTRVRLRETGDATKARDRLFQLLSAIRRGVPLDDIKVAA